MEKVRRDYERILSGGSEKAKPNPLISSNMLVTISVGIVMTVIGYNYTWKYHKGEAGVRAYEDNLCPNGAAWWLWISGICTLLIITLLNGERVVSKEWPFVYYILLCDVHCMDRHFHLGHCRGVRCLGKLDRRLRNIQGRPWEDELL